MEIKKTLRNGLMALALLGAAGCATSPTYFTDSPKYRGPERTISQREKEAREKREFNYQLERNQRNHEMNKRTGSNWPIEWTITF